LREQVRYGIYMKLMFKRLNWSELAQNRLL
jgi:hypothetical protein